MADSTKSDIDLFFHSDCGCAIIDIIMLYLSIIQVLYVEKSFHEAPFQHNIKKSSWEKMHCFLSSTECTLTGMKEGRG